MKSNPDLIVIIISHYSQVRYYKYYNCKTCKGKFLLLFRKIVTFQLHISSRV